MDFIELFPSSPEMQSHGIMPKHSTVEKSFLKGLKQDHTMWCSLGPALIQNFRVSRTKFLTCFNVRI